MWSTLKSDVWNVGQVDADRSSPESVSSTDSTSKLAVPGSGGEEIDSPPPSRHAAVAKEPKAKVETSKSRNSFGVSTEKPSLSYIALISGVIMESPESRMLLNDIYSAIVGRYPYYALNDDKAWKNSIRHNLSLNECFIKSGRADNGKGNYWAIHPACMDDFRRGDFRRRQARRKSKRCMKSMDASSSHTTGYHQSLAMSSSYPYNVGYVTMNRMPTGCSTVTSGYPYGPPQAAIIASSSSPSTSALSSTSFLTSSASQLPPAVTSYAGYLHAHGVSGTAAPNVNTAQLDSFASTNHGAFSQRTQSQLVASQLGMTPQLYNSSCLLYPSNSSYYPSQPLVKDNIQFR